MTSFDSICLIMSGAYVGPELAAEFGLLPPAFLPVGTSRLYELQIPAFGERRPIYLTLPEGFTPSPEDMRRFDELGVSILYIPADLNLGNAVIYALNLIGGGDQKLSLLHGDTLIPDLPANTDDCIAVTDDNDGYSWAEVDVSGHRVRSLETVPPSGSRDFPRPIAAGYFALRSSTRLIRAITRCHGDFVAALNLYAEERPLQAEHVSTWLDFGHVQTYFRSRRAVATARAFNSLRIDGLTVRKSSEDSAKMAAEAAWLGGVPAPLKIYTARLIDAGEEDTRGYYETEYEYVPNLAELFVFGTLGRPVWSRILQSSHDFLSLCAAQKGTGSGDAALQALAVDKTFTRLRRFADDTGFDIDAPLSLGGRPFPSLNGIAAITGDLISAPSGRVETLMHGDFCFSNILYNARNARIRVIDPRGYMEVGQPTCFGDLRYDLAKLAHSIIGRYDQIIAGRYAMSATDGMRFSITFENAPHQTWLESALEDFVVDGIPIMSAQILATMVSLFLSMVPLHADRPDRQRAFIANALRLFSALERVPA